MDFGSRNANAWEQRKLGDLYRVAGSGGTPAVGNSNFYDGNIPFLSISDMRGRDTSLTAKTITQDGLNSSAAWLVPAGAIALAMYASVGKTAIIKRNMATSQAFFNMVFTDDVTTNFVFTRLERAEKEMEWEPLISTGTQRNLNAGKVRGFAIQVPSLPEQRQIGTFFKRLDDLITLHQRKPLMKGVIMLTDTRKEDLFYLYYKQWVTVYKEGAIRTVTMNKYQLTQSWLERLAPKLKVGEITRVTYQKLLNDYAKEHERQTTMDFHHQLKGAILDAVDEGLIDRDPTRKAIIKGRTPKQKKPKYLNQFELHKLLTSLELGTELSWDWAILLIAKTGIRFSEAMAVTPRDFDFPRQTLSIDKTWNYKEQGGFIPTKNRSSVRKIQMDWRLIIQFSELIKNMPADEPIFATKRIFNSTANHYLARRCVQAGIPVITIHGLRHTHASLLLFAGVSIASVARRLGHASMTTTQKTYLHIIQELENQDVDLVMRSLSGLM